MPRPATELRRVRALSARTHFVAGFGQIHFNPDSEKEDVREPFVPVAAIEALVRNGWIADDLDSPLDHDGDGRAGGSLPGAKSTAAKGKRAKAGAKSTADDSAREDQTNDEAPADANVGAETPAADEGAASEDAAP